MKSSLWPCDLHPGWYPIPSVTASDRRIFCASNGGVAANRSSLLFVLISLATNLDRYSGLPSSPLFTSTHLVPMGAAPVSLQHSSVGTFSYTPCLANSPISSTRALSTISVSRGLPERSSQNSGSPPWTWHI